MVNTHSHSLSLHLRQKGDFFILFFPLYLCVDGEDDTWGRFNVPLL